MRRSAFVAAFLSLLIATPGGAQAAGPPWPAEVSVPSSKRLQFESAVNGVSYTLAVRVPLTPPPPEGYPVIYVLDGDLLFGLASDIGLTIDPRRAPVVVAIGHGVLENMDVVAKHSGRRPGDTGPIGLPQIGLAMNSLRFQEYTLPVAPDHRAPAWTGLTPDNVGGLDDFLRVLETEIKPRVEASVSINRADQALFGHSIAGLAVLRALFTNPDAFRTYIAASPSIWWDADVILEDVPGFSRKVEGGQVSPRLLLTVGADEPDSPNPPQSFIDTLPPEQAESLRAYVAMASQWGGMVSGSRSLASRLDALRGGSAYKVRFIAFEGESHASVLPSALSRGMRFAFEQ